MCCVGHRMQLITWSVRTLQSALEGGDLVDLRWLPPTSSIPSSTSKLSTRHLSWQEPPPSRPLPLARPWSCSPVPVSPLDLADGMQSCEYEVRVHQDTRFRDQTWRWVVVERLCPSMYATGLNNRSLRRYIVLVQLSNVEGRTMNTRPLSIRCDVSTAVLKELFVPNFPFTVRSSISKNGDY